MRKEMSTTMHTNMSIIEILPKRFSAACALALLACGTNAAAELVRVEWFNRQCGALIVKTALGYAYVQQVSPGMLTEGDTLDGDFERDARMQEVKNTSTRTSVTVWVEKFASDKQTVLEHMPASCKPEDSTAK